MTDTGYTFTHIRSTLEPQMPRSDPLNPGNDDTWESRYQRALDGYSAPTLSSYDRSWLRFRAKHPHLDRIHGGFWGIVALVGKVWVLLLVALAVAVMIAGAYWGITSGQDSGAYCERHPELCNENTFDEGGATP